MTQIQYRKEEMPMFVVETDSMGRTPDQVEAMDKNALRPHRLSKRDKAYAESVSRMRASYPKVLYRLALKKGVPAGDEVAPSYPMPHDLAQSLGITDRNFKILGKTRDSGGYLLVRHPYVTFNLAVYKDDDPNGLVDLEATAELEKKMKADGWVENPNDIIGLPEHKADEEFDPIPAQAKKEAKQQPRTI
jgi:hypothetical protein